LTFRETLLYVVKAKSEVGPFGREVKEQFEKHGTLAGKSFGQKLNTGLSTLGPMAASAVGLALSYAIESGMKEPIAALKTTIKNSGGSFDEWKDKIEETAGQMEKFGFSSAETDTSIINLTRSTNSVELALKSQTAVANLATAKHVSLADASIMLSRAADGSMKALKGLNIVTVSGANQAQAMGNAQKTLGAQIQAAGGMAGFARAHHMTLAEAERLTAEAAGSAAMAQAQLAQHGTTLARVTTLLAQAQSGDAKATQDLSKLHLSLGDAQKIVSEAAGGNIDAFNRLGITVLPKTATAAQRLEQIQKVLNERLGGSAQAAANTFGGKVRVLKVEFEDMAAKIGQMILPYLSKFMSLLLKIADNKPLLVTIAVAITAIAAAWVGVRIAALIAATSMRTALISSGVGVALLALSVLLVLIADHWKTLEKWALIALRAIGDAARVVWRALTAGWNAFFNFMRPAFKVMAEIGRIAFLVISTEAKIAWDIVTGIVLAAWHVVIKPIFELIKLQAKATWLVVSTFCRIMWNDVLKPVWSAIRRVVLDDLSAIAGTARRVWDGVGAFFRGMWNNVLRPALVILWNTFKTVFGSIIHGAAAAFGWIPGLGPKLKDAAKQFDSFANSVNKSLGGINDKTVNVGVQMAYRQSGVGHAVGPGMAGGGTIRGPGGPMSDTAGLFMLSNGEYVVKASSVSKYGVPFMNQLNAGKLATGGLAVAVHTPPPGQIDKGIWGSVNAIAKAFWTQILGAVGGGLGGSGVARWSGVVLQALAMAGLGPQYLRQVLYQMQTESGGNPFAQNNTDINAQLGHPSKGLLQVIQPTFDAFANGLRYLGIWSPLANVFSAIRYAQAVYGPTMMSGGNGLGSGHGYARGGFVSYDNGGILRPGFTLAYNGTGRDEIVSRGGVTVIVQARAVLGTKREVAAYVADALQEYSNRGGKLPR